MNLLEAIKKSSHLKEDEACSFFAYVQFIIFVDDIKLYDKNISLFFSFFKHNSFWKTYKK